MTPKVGTVCQRFVINLKDDILNCKNILNIRAVGKALVKVHNAGIVVAHADFLFGAAHSVRHISCERSRCNFYLAELCTDLCKCGFHTYSYVRRAANNICKLSVACINLEKMKLL